MDALSSPVAVAATATAGAAADSHATANPENVKVVFGWLVALTVIEVGFVYLHLPRPVLATLLIGSSVAKATLVALFFMHLRFERKLVHSLVILPVLLAAMFVLALFPDIVIGYWK